MREASPLEDESRHVGPEGHHLQTTRNRSNGKAPSSLREPECIPTLCGSEVPQDRWRERTAGSGMWTLDRESAIMEPPGDSASPYG